MMSMVRCIFLMLSLLIARDACAMMIDLVAPSRVSAGSNFQVDVNLSGLEDTDPLIGAFSFTFAISDNALAQFLPVDSQFGGFLGAIDLGETFGLVDVRTEAQATFIDVLEVSFLSTGALFDLQDGLSEFTLFSFGLNALRFADPANRTVGVSVTDVVLADSAGDVVFRDSGTTGTFITLVPEPSTLALLVLGFIGLTRTRWARLGDRPWRSVL